MVRLTFCSVEELFEPSLETLSDSDPDVLPEFDWLSEFDWLPDSDWLLDPESDKLLELDRLDRELVDVDVLREPDPLELREGAEEEFQELDDENEWLDQSLELLQWWELLQSCDEEDDQLSLDDQWLDDQGNDQDGILQGLKFSLARPRVLQHHLLQTKHSARVFHVL